MRNLIATAALLLPPCPPPTPPPARQPAQRTPSHWWSFTHRRVVRAARLPIAGCRSCRRASTPSRAVPLALHVGYWDYIGWKDPFAKREFNDRQSQLAALNGNRTRYTPGVFVQGRETNWSSGDGVRCAVAGDQSACLPPRRSRSTRSRRRAAKSRCARTRSLTAPASAKNPRLFVALVQNGISTKVTAGENRGETLANDRVARAWSGPLPIGHAKRLAQSAIDFCA